MNKKTIQPGDTLIIHCPVEHKTPFGLRTVDVRFEFSYQDIVKGLKPKRKKENVAQSEKVTRVIRRPRGRAA